MLLVERDAMLTVERDAMLTEKSTISETDNSDRAWRGGSQFCFHDLSTVLGFTHPQRTKIQLNLTIWDMSRSVT